MVITSQDLETKTQAARLLGLLDLGELPEAQCVAQAWACPTTVILCGDASFWQILTVLMLLDKVRSGHQDPQVASSWLMCFCLSEDSSLKTLTMETVQLNKTLAMIESSTGFGVHRLQALQVDLQIGSKNISRCGQPKQMHANANRRVVN